MTRHVTATKKPYVVRKKLNLKKLNLARQSKADVWHWLCSLRQPKIITKLVPATQSYQQESRLRTHKTQCGAKYKDLNGKTTTKLITTYAVCGCVDAANKPGPASNNGSPISSNMSMPNGSLPKIPPIIASEIKTVDVANEFKHTAFHLVQTLVIFY